MLPPLIVGIVGRSCAGKTWLATRLHERLGGSASRLSLDDFYLDQGHLEDSERACLNFDHPDLIDWAQVEQVLKGFWRGEDTPVPCYDFPTHRRLAMWKTLASTPILIVEGLWLFHHSFVREYFDLKIYVRGASGLCWKRRLQRDTAVRKRKPDQIREQWEGQAEPMFEKYVAPQEEWADLILKAPISESEASFLAGQISTLPAREHSEG